MPLTCPSVSCTLHARRGLMRLALFQVMIGSAAADTGVPACHLARQWVSNDGWAQLATLSAQALQTTYI